MYRLPDEELYKELHLRVQELIAEELFYVEDDWSYLPYPVPGSFAEAAENFHFAVAKLAKEILEQLAPLLELIPVEEEKETRIIRLKNKLNPREVAWLQRIWRLIHEWYIKT